MEQKHTRLFQIVVVVLINYYEDINTSSNILNIDNKTNCQHYDTSVFGNAHYWLYIARSYTGHIRVIEHVPRRWVLASYHVLDAGLEVAQEGLGLVALDLAVLDGLSPQVVVHLDGEDGR